MNDRDQGQYDDASTQGSARRQHRTFLVTRTPIAIVRHVHGATKSDGRAPGDAEVGRPDKMRHQASDECHTKKCHK
jgi:hypothetical protein